MKKPEEFNFKLEELLNNYKELQNNYIELYEMFDYLNKSRDDYISENIELRKHKRGFKILCIYFFICFVIELILFLFAVIL